MILVLTVAGCTAVEQPGDTNGVTATEPLPISALAMTEAISNEWKASGKQFAMPGVAGRAGNTCAECHDGYAFAKKNEIDFATEWNPGNVNEALTPGPDHITGIDCQACHTGAGAEYMASGIVETPYAVINNAGTGAACIFCHSGRRNTPAMYEDYLANYENDIRITYPHYGPAEHFTGKGGMEYPDMDYSSTLAHANLKDSCVACHMPKTEKGYKSHTFTMETASIGRACGDCHSGIDTFNLNGFQDKVKDMNYKLKDAILEATGAVDITTGAGQLRLIGSDGEPLPSSQITPEAFVAAYNYYGVYSEGSWGVHNPRYAQSIIKNSYYKLTGEEMQ